ALRREGGHRRRGRAGRSARRQAAFGLPRLDPRRRGAGLREVRGSAFRGRTLLEDRVVEPGLAPGRDLETLKAIGRVLPPRGAPAAAARSSASPRPRARDAERALAAGS